MRKNLSLYIALILSAILAGLNLLALEYHLYWTLWWYDILLHFLAGFIGGLATYWVLFNSKIFGNGESLRKSTRVLMVFVCVMIAGLAWEWMEYAFGLTNSHEGYPIDPIFDLILDGAGAVLATLISLKKAHNPVRD